tara:strand:- start:4532 stop:4765 length:234 start_codon:yes stop_codon:yes gene_type:complete
MPDYKKEWTKKAEKLLLNRKIVKVEWMGKNEADNIGWSSKPVCILLDNDMWIFPMADDEGNDGGALAVGPEETLPVF